MATYETGQLVDWQIVVSFKLAFCFIWPLVLCLDYRQPASKQNARSIPNVNKHLHFGLLLWLVLPITFPRLYESLLWMFRNWEELELKQETSWSWERSFNWAGKSFSCLLPMLLKRRSCKIKPKMSLCHSFGFQNRKVMSAKTSFPF